MSKEKEEMVTIEVSLHAAKAIAGNSIGFDNCTHECEVVAKFREALAARKTLYEQWRETLELPWTPSTKPYGRNMSLLMAAAPQLLEALINSMRLHDWGPIGIEADAIRVALPEDVADEVLGVKR